MLSDAAAPYWIKGYYSGVEFLRGLGVTIPLEEWNVSSFYANYPSGYIDKELGSYLASREVDEPEAEDAPVDGAPVDPAA